MILFGKKNKEHLTKEEKQREIIETRKEGAVTTSKDYDVPEKWDAFYKAVGNAKKKGVNYEASPDAIEHDMVRRLLERIRLIDMDATEQVLDSYINDSPMYGTITLFDKLQKRGVNVDRLKQRVYDGRISQGQNSRLEKATTLNGLLSKLITDNQTLTDSIPPYHQKGIEVDKLQEHVATFVKNLNGCLFQYATAEQRVREMESDEIRLQKVPTYSEKFDIETITGKVPLSQNLAILGLDILLAYTEGMPDEDLIRNNNMAIYQTFESFAKKYLARMKHGEAKTGLEQNLAFIQEEREHFVGSQRPLIEQTQNQMYLALQEKAIDANLEDKVFVDEVKKYVAFMEQHSTILEEDVGMINGSLQQLYVARNDAKNNPLPAIQKDRQHKDNMVAPFDEKNYIKIVGTEPVLKTA